MIKRLDKIIEEVVNDGGELDIKLYTSPRNKKERKHNEDMESIIHLLGEITEEEAEKNNIGFCRCTRKTDKTTILTFYYDLLEIANRKIKELIFSEEEL